MMRMLGCSGQSKMDPELCQRPVSTEWWRRGESEYSGLLKTLNLFILRHPKNAENGKNCAQLERIWNAPAKKRSGAAAEW